MRRKTLRTAFRPRRRTRRAAFSLVELVVALGILLLMLSLAGQVMSLTVKSTGQATALTEINQRIRTLEKTLRDDLAKVKPGETVLVIAGNPINAYWTREGKEADDDGDPLTGYPNNLGPIYQTPLDATASANAIELVPTPPRADVLMFFTTSSKPYKSAIQYDYGDPALDGQSPRAYIQQVVYGHAELGDWRSDAADKWSLEDVVSFPKPEDPYLEYVPQLPPAQAWHLARRGVLLTNAMPIQSTPPWVYYGAAENLDSDRLLEAVTDVYSTPGEDPSKVLLQKPCGAGNACGDPFYWPEIFAGGVVPYKRSRLDISPPPAIQDENKKYIPPPLGHYFLPNCASFRVEWTFDPASTFVDGRLDLESELYWIDPGNTGDKLLDHQDDDPIHALNDTVEALENIPTPTQFEYQRRLNLGGDPAQVPPVDGLLTKKDQTGNTIVDRFGWKRKKDGTPDYDGGSPWIVQPPYGDGLRKNVHVFTVSRAPKPTPPGADPEYDPEEIFPKALRITVDLWDANGRLDRPVRHVMVLPIGEAD